MIVILYLMIEANEVSLSDNSSIINSHSKTVIEAANVVI